jgi:hypothetical protein
MLLKFKPFIFIVIFIFLTGCKPKEPMKMNLQTINNAGVPPSTYIEVEGIPSYYYMVYSYTYEGDPNNITSIENIYYPIMAKEQYELYKKCQYTENGNTYIDSKKARSLGIKFRIFVRHKNSYRSFLDNPGDEILNTYRGVAKSENEIDKEALDIIKSDPEIRSILTPELTVIYME